MHENFTADGKIRVTGHSLDAGRKGANEKHVASNRPHLEGGFDCAVAHTCLILFDKFRSTDTDSLFWYAACERAGRARDGRCGTNLLPSRHQQAVHGDDAHLQQGQGHRLQHLPVLPEGWKLHLLVYVGTKVVNWPRASDLCLTDMQNSRHWLSKFSDCVFQEAFSTITTDLSLSEREDFYFGAKLVRGAYMEQVGVVLRTRSKCPDVVQRPFL